MANSALSAQAVETKKIILLRPRGFCAGVVRAIDVVKIALDLYGAPIYVRKEIVHNRHVVDELRGAGAIFVEELDEVPRGRARDLQRPWRFAAGADRRDGAEVSGDRRHLPAGHESAPGGRKFARKGYTIVLIGHKDHDEVIGTLGEAPESTITGLDRRGRGPAGGEGSGTSVLHYPDHAEPG